MAVGKLFYNIVNCNEKKSGSDNCSRKGFGIRHLQILLLFLCVVMGYSLRSQLGVVMVAMVKHDDSTICNNTRNEMTTDKTSVTANNKKCSSLQENNEWSVYRNYDWNKVTQEIVTFSFFVGYTSMQLPMGWLIQRVGGKIPIIIGLAFNGISVFCTPWILLVSGWLGVSICRLLQGMTQAALDPSVITMLAKWTPPCERGRMTTYVFSGYSVGTIIAFQISGLLANNPAFGWPASFWLFGILSLIVCGLFWCFGAASPQDYPGITANEFLYILENDNINSLTKKRSTPWKAIIKCPAVWGIIIAQAGSGAVMLLILTEIPSYMTNILGIDVETSGLYSSLPFIAMYFTSILCGYVADFAGNKNILKTVNIRRIANTIGSVGSGMFLLAFSFANNTVLAVSLLVLSLGTASGTQVGFVVNQIDLAPNFAGSISALANMCGCITSVLVPLVVSNIITDVKNQDQWQIVFVIFIGFLFICNAIYVIFAKGDVQPWNYYGEKEYVAEDTKPNVIKKKEIKRKAKFIISEK